MRWYGLILLGLFSPFSAMAFEDAPPPPTITEASAQPRVNGAETQPTDQELLEQAELEPQVTIIRRERDTIEEYRVNGVLKMVKVTPDFGPAYYLIDNDGDGTLETSRFALDSNAQVPQWILFSW
ncbi:DUF2782 domain-containing protein [Candidatus Albibeggiatoa sp. nov. NOAA]|uniref:DUF2782 domain-containing protein n=1 Tax=Candidatus Albibeggiatoa sp. nov. NOAA TaxID=3162724 RepID=UPI0032FAD6A0|nr:DUF2782 domain-containing protein [Thiotrichaceae bacterium]